MCPNIYEVQVMNLEAYFSENLIDDFTIVEFYFVGKTGWGIKIVNKHKSLYIFIV